MTANGKKFATASLVTEETNIIQIPDLTMDDLKRLQVIAMSAFSPFWETDETGHITDIFEYTIAKCPRHTDAVYISSFSPEVMDKIIELAIIGLKVKLSLED
jgi:hypothetical protein